MASFRDPESAQCALDRIANFSSANLAQLVEKSLDENADPDLAVTNLERWLNATSSPGLYLEQMMGRPHESRLILSLIGASQPIADVIIQNPELPSLMFEPAQLNRIPTVAAVLAEGRELLASASGYSHSLDRLRFLKQRWYFAITLNDLGDRWPQETVWQALSDLADGIVELTCETVWKEVKKTRQLPEACPVMVVGFGKLGGHELNYSSDIDLVYVLEDGLDERTTRDCSQFCHELGRALSNRMGRGNLFRVDLRLRPYSSAGAVLNSMTGYESYYTRYAEAWEIQAFLRSRAIVGPPSLTARWEAMRINHCFKPRLTEGFLEEVVSMRSRIEESSGPNDIKRGSGGIRDVEFLAQVGQLVHGNSVSELRVQATLPVLRGLAKNYFLGKDAAADLEAGYTFLRQLEHRLQLVGDLQTHDIPTRPQARDALAKTMGCSDWTMLESRLIEHRRKIDALYRQIIQPAPQTTGARAFAIAELGALGESLAQWFDGLDSSEAFYAGLTENEGSLERVRIILDFAPSLVERLRQSLALTEQILSGEIEEPGPLSERLTAISDPSDYAGAARAYIDATTKVLLRWVLSPDHRPEGELSSFAELMLDKCVDWQAPDITVIALGSFANREMGLDSDMDLLLISEDPTRQSDAEREAQRLLSWFEKLRQYGADIEADLRLRPEGRKGLLVRTLQGLQTYAKSDLELWERFALGHARLLRGSQKALAVVLEMAYGLPINAARIEELLEMKRRIEDERVKPQHLRRNVKLGHGGLNDIEWLVHLHEMKFPLATGAHGGGNLRDRIHLLAEAEFINALESEFLLRAHAHLLDVRLRLQLLGFHDDLVPENPDKLDRLARSSGDADGNAFLGRHEPIIDGVRRLYHESLERLLK